MSKEKDLVQIQELVRKMHSLISPMSYHDTLKDLRTKPATDVFKGDFNKCVIPWKVGAQQVHLPVCNRFGMIDPQMIQFSKKIVNRMRSVSPQDEGGTNIIIAKLDKLNKKFSKDIPRPSDRAAMNGQVTKFTNRLLNNIKGHLT